MKQLGIVGSLKRYPVAVLCVLVLCVLGVYAFIRSGVNEELSAKEESLSARIRTIEANSKMSKNLEAQTTQLEGQVEEVGERLFVPNQRAVNTGFFYSLEKGSGLVFSEVKQQGEADPMHAKGGARELKLHTTVVYSLSVNGSYENFLKFLNRIDQHPDRFLRVSDVEVNQTGGERAGQDHITARIRVVGLAEK